MTVLLAACGLSWAFLGSVPHPVALDWLRAALVFLAGAWLAWGSALALAGLAVQPAPPPRGAVAGRTAVLVLLCDEETGPALARIAAVRASLSATEHAHLFEMVVLSDSDPRAGRAEAEGLSRLIAEAPGAVPLMYRRRADRRGRKAGNIADFLRRSGGRYRYAVVLDADSLMEGETLVEMVRRMEGAPDLGLLQSVPRVIGARSRFGRAMQFASGLSGPLQAAGLAALQGRAGPYWGHNAILRVAPFTTHCGLAELPGSAPFGGPVMSHDYVEAALLVRAGWGVRIDPDLGGSFEEGPEDILAHARRDRRWCQGNMQHARLIPLEGLAFWSRVTFALNVATYAMAPLWSLFLLASLLRPLATGAEPHAGTLAGSEGLIFAVIGLLVLPRVAALLHDLVRSRHGNRLHRTGAALGELGFSALVAPILLAWQLRAVLEVLTGRDGGWPAHPPAGECLGLARAWEASRWIATLGLAGFALTVAVALGSLYFVVPVFLPMVFAPLIVWWSSRSPWRASSGPVPEVARRRDAFAGALSRSGA